MKAINNTIAFFLGDGNFCKGRADGDYEREKGQSSFFYNNCLNEVCSFRACVKFDEVFDQSEGKCVFKFETT